MIKVSIAIIALIALSGSAFAMPWMSIETHTLYRTDSWTKFSEPMKNAHIATGGSDWAVWNETAIVLNHNTKVLHFSVYGLYNLWVGSRYMAMLLKNGTFLITPSHTISSHYINVSHIKDVSFSKNYAVISGSDDMILNLSTWKVENLRGYTFLGFSGSSELIFGKNNYLYGFKGFDKVWSLKFEEKVRQCIFSEYYYVLTTNHLYVLSQNHKIIAATKTNGEKIAVASNKPFLLSEIEDDEGEVQWIFNEYQLKGNKLEIAHTFFSYVKPIKIGVLGKYMAFYTRKTVDIISSGLHIYSNNTFSKIGISQNYLIAINKTGVYTLSFESISKSLSKIGHDQDMDWIPDYKDKDADNDGMPNWWEEKYGLNPLNPSDANQDPDHDGLTNYQEYMYGTNPTKWDTDGDGLSDGYEISHGLNPLIPNYKLVYDMPMINYLIMSLLIVLALIGSARERE